MKSVRELVYDKVVVIRVVKLPSADIHEQTVPIDLLWVPRVSVVFQDQYLGVRGVEELEDGLAFKGGSVSRSYAMEMREWDGV